MKKITQRLTVFGIENPQSSIIISQFMLSESECHQAQAQVLRTKQGGRGIRRVERAKLCLPVYNKKDCLSHIPHRIEFGEVFILGGGERNGEPM